jgi:hypothetical protein
VGIDADDYIILVRTDSHPAERHLVYRDDAVGLSDARKRKACLKKEVPWAPCRNLPLSHTRGKDPCGLEIFASGPGKKPGPLILEVGHVLPAG